MENLDYYRIEKALNYLDINFKKQPSLEDIAKELKISSFYLQRLFKRWAGISPKRFLQFLTLEYTKEKLRKSSNLLDATFESGLSSSSRLYELFTNIDSITPKEFTNSGMNLQIYYGIHNSPFGKCLIAITKRGICNLSFIEESNDNQWISELKEEWKNAELIKDFKKTEPIFNKIFYPEKINNKEKINVFLKGTNFQIRVWKALIQIPEGSLTTYEEIAKKIGNPKASRAVGSAIGSNNISFLIPCHRVINKIGTIGKYRWGAVRKKAIIAWEEARFL